LAQACRPLHGPRAGVQKPPVPRARAMLDWLPQCPVERNKFPLRSACQRSISADRDADTVRVRLDGPGSPGEQGFAGQAQPGPEAAGEPRRGMVFEQMKEAALGWWGHLTDIALEYPLKELAAATGNFGPKHRLGEGAAGAVFRGTLRGGTEVAVKVLNDMGGLEGFEDEVRVLSRFRHPNVVTLLGWAQHESKKYLVYELLPCGDLQGRLVKSREGKAQFSWQQRLHVALGTASGLSHMMNSKPMAFHRDIKPANILLDTDGSAKIADFGLAGVVHQEGVRHMMVQNISGTPGYVCPTYALSGRVTEASEVYAFGTVLLELLLNQPPALQGPEGDLMFPLLQVVQPAAPGAHARLMAALDPTAAWPAAFAEELADLALTCVDLVPERRPNFETCVRVLRQLRGATGARGGGG